MADLPVHPRHRTAVRVMLDEALRVANGPPGFTRESHRKWVAEPSESLRKLLDQAGIDPTAWFIRIAAFKAHWDRPGGG